MTIQANYCWYVFFFFWWNEQLFTHCAQYVYDTQLKWMWSCESADTCWKTLITFMNISILNSLFRGSIWLVYICFLFWCDNKIQYAFTRKCFRSTCSLVPPTGWQRKEEEKPWAFHAIKESIERLGIGCMICCKWNLKLIWRGARQTQKRPK